MLKGSIVALVAPFKKDLSLDEEKLRELINWHIENSTDGILVCGTTGESATLSHEEHRRVIDIAIEEAAGRVPVVAGMVTVMSEPGSAAVRVVSLVSAVEPSNWREFPWVPSKAAPLVTSPTVVISPEPTVTNSSSSLVAL